MNFVRLKTCYYLGSRLTGRFSSPSQCMFLNRPLCVSTYNATYPNVQNQPPKVIAEQTNLINRNFSSTSIKFADNEVKAPLSKKDQLKKAVKDYGSTVIVFHVSISLVSLGICYLIVSSGVDLTATLDKIGFGTDSSIIKGGSTFVVAYAIHKVLAPVRISITLASTPFIVRFLRAKGILKSLPKK